MTTFMYRQRDGFVLALIVVMLLCGLAYSELRVPELNAIDNDDISADTANAADLLSLAVPTAFAGEITKDIALPSHRELSRSRKIKAQRFQSAVARIERRDNVGRPVESVSHSTARDLLHQFCIQRI